jgi:hypothetical protein
MAATGALFFGASEVLAGSAPVLGPDTIGCFEPSYVDQGAPGAPNAVWYLRDDNSTGPVSVWTEFGEDDTTFLPVAAPTLPGSPVSGIALFEQASTTVGFYHVKDDATTSGVEDETVEVAIEPSLSATTPPIPLAGTFGGPGVPGIALYYPDAGVFMIDTDPGDDTTVAPFLFGPVAPGDIIPVAGDWDGDGTDTVGVFQNSTGVWYLTNQLQDGTVQGFQFGPTSSGWTPVVGNWDLLGGDSVGFYDTTNGLFRLRNTNTAGPADIKAYLGEPGGNCQPVAGNWGIAAP